MLRRVLVMSLLIYSVTHIDYKKYNNICRGSHRIWDNDKNGDVRTINVLWSIL